MPRYVVSLEEAERMIQSMVPKIEKAIMRGLKSSALLLEGKIVEQIDIAKPYPAVDTGALRGSFQTKITKDGIMVYSDLPYAAVMEFGARPFFPPVEPLAEWVERKGIATNVDDVQGIAWAIAKKISTQGIKPRYFTKKAIKVFTPLLKAEVEREIDGLA